MKLYALKTYLYVTTLIATGIIFYNCRKINADRSVAYLNQSPSEAFLNVPANSNPIFKRIAATIKVQDDRLHFLKNIAVKEGIPHWEGSTILAGGNMPLSGSSGTNQSQNSAGDTIVLIPLVLKNTEYVNSFLACKVKDTVAVSLFSGRNYKKYGFQATANKLSAENMAMQMMKLEYQTFRHDKFLIRDRHLFNRLPGNQVPNKTMVQLGANKNNGLPPGGQNTNSPLSLMVPVTTTSCQDVWISNDNGQLVGCPPGDPNCNGGHFETQCQTNIFWIEIMDDAGGGGLPISDWPTSPTSGGNGSGTGTGGWLSYSFTGVDHLSTWQTTTADAQKINYWATNNIDTTKLDSCRKLILRKLLNSNGINIIGRLLTKLDRAIGDSSYLDNFRIRFVTVDSLRKYPTLGGRFSKLSYSANSPVVTATILINDSVIQHGSDLYVANVLLHETIHGYLAYLFHRIIKEKYNADQLASLGFSEAFTAYVDTLRRRDSLQIPVDEMGGNQDYDHNYMANAVVNKMAEALSLFDNNRLATIMGSSAADEYYWTLTWAGLYNSKTFKSYWSKYPSLPISNPAPNEYTTNGLKYALTSNRLMNINNRDVSERTAGAGAKGHIPISGGCY